MFKIKKFNDALALCGIASILALIGLDAALPSFTLNETFVGFIITSGTLIFQYYYRKTPSKESEEGN